ncbi:MFS transporter [Thermococcus sp. CX2]|uniref:MFS transporter n=1 Tax=Thermococcus sp. CX2 TaxID=163006 RepID=UPI00143BF7BA|nr:MFS transporter [Thermococcus sp. CX2]NJE85655.1 MFS transporter [Thermococcus sp. CX2]
MKKALYHLYLLIASLRVAGDAIETVALPWSILNATGSLISIGGYALFTHLPWVILPPILGRTLDRTVKKVRLAFLALILQAFLAVLIIPLSSNIWAFYLLVSGISALDILHRYYGFSLVASMTLHESELQRLNATKETVGEATSLLAYPLAGFLAYRFGIWSMLIDAALLFIGALALIPYLNVDVKREKETKERSKPAKIRRKLVIGFMITLLLFNFALGSFRIFVFSSLRALEKGEVIYGLLQSLTTVGSLVAVLGITYFAHRRKLGIRRPLLAGMLLQSFALILVGLPKVAALLPAVFVLGLGGALINVSFDSLFQKVFPLERLGTFRGIFDALATLVIPISQILFAWLIERGLSPLGLSSGAFLIALVALAFLQLSLRAIELG